MIISLSFDDGREDNFKIAYPLLKRYGLPATFFVTTGFIDGTLVSDDFGIGRKAMSIANLKVMQDGGMEIASHGDRHITETADFRLSLQKLRAWGLSGESVGFSVPHLECTGQALEDFIAENHDFLTYARVNRDPRCYRFLSKAYYAGYHLTKMACFYDAFNHFSLMKKTSPFSLYSPMLHSDVRVGGLKKFIAKHSREDCWLILTFHSIVENPTDRWEWGADSFEALLSFLKEQKAVQTLTIQAAMPSFIKQ